MRASFGGIPFLYYHDWSDFTPSFVQLVPNKLSEPIDVLESFILAQNDHMNVFLIPEWYQDNWTASAKGLA